MKLAIFKGLMVKDRTVIFSFVMFLMSGFIAGEALAGSHSVISAMRSSELNNTFISQEVDGEYGYYDRIKAGEKVEDGENRLWQGFGIRNTVGVELMKFVQFGVSHTLLNMNSKENSFEHILGSRFSGETKAIFYSPVGNVEVGAGILASTIDYQWDLTKSHFFGSGFYYTGGVNYFMSNQVSVFISGKLFKENLVRNSGSEVVENIKTDTKSAGVGFNFWM
ncbi:MAG: hypothetical protein HQK54_00185 [Oligoflexales bacterium]|nr:hypothetical protein [Oligoflexales bacterium]